MQLNSLLMLTHSYKETSTSWAVTKKETKERGVVDIDSIAQSIFIPPKDKTTTYHPILTIIGAVTFVLFILGEFMFFHL